jgi:drug/metabolite transporter (DMT)-like permease
LLDAISLATYFLVSAAGTREALPLVVVGWGGMCVGAAFLAIAGETGIPSVSADAGDVELLRRHVSWIAPVLELSLVAAAVPYVAAIAAARRLGARRASVIGIAEVLLAVLYERPLLGQLPSAMQFTGGAFMLAGVVLVHVDENQQGRANPLGRTPRPRRSPSDLPADQPVACPARRLDSLPRHQRPASVEPPRKPPHRR